MLRRRATEFLLFGSLFRSSYFPQPLCSIFREKGSKTAVFGYCRIWTAIIAPLFQFWAFAITISIKHYFGAYSTSTPVTTNFGKSGLVKGECGKSVSDSLHGDAKDVNSTSPMTAAPYCELSMLARLV